MVYNLQGVTDLHLAPATVAGIFNGSITDWNAPQIAADNPGKTLPDQAITPVHRSDESGTTQNFTDYLNKAAPDVWTAKAAGTWPVQAGEAAQGTSGVIGAVQGGNGTIGYADESQAGSLGKVLVRSATTSSARPRRPRRSPRRVVAVEGRARAASPSPRPRDRRGRRLPRRAGLYQIGCTNTPTPARRIW